MVSYTHYRGAYVRLKFGSATEINGVADNGHTGIDGIIEQPEPVFPRLFHSIACCPNVQPDKATVNAAVGLASAMLFPYNKLMPSSLLQITLFCGFLPVF